jgi:hypothetical protein
VPGVRAQLGYLLAKAHSLGDNEFNATVVPYSFEDELLALVGDRANGFAREVRTCAVAVTVPAALLQLSASVVRLACSAVRCSAAARSVLCCAMCC